MHEGFLRLAEREGIEGRSRGQFLAYVGRDLRSVLIDELRAEERDKRGADLQHLTLSAAEAVPSPRGTADLLALDQAMARIAQIDPGLYELLEAIGFAGLTVPEAAALRGCSPRSINRELAKARALLQELIDGPP